VIGAVRPSARAARVLPPNFNPPVRRRRPSGLDGPLTGGPLPGGWPSGGSSTGGLSSGGQLPNGPLPGGLSTGGDVGRETGGDNGTRELPRLPRGGDLDAVPSGPGVRENNRENNTVERRGQVGENQVYDNQVVNGQAGNDGGREMSHEEVIEMVQSILDRLGIRIDPKDLDSGGPIRVSGNGWTITRDGGGN
jgi:hypothetical protein